MAVKTITVDMEAYELLARAKRGGESFSDVVKRVLRPGTRPSDVIAAAARARISDETLDSMEEAIRRSRAQPARRYFLAADSDADEGARPRKRRPKGGR